MQHLAGPRTRKDFAMTDARVRRQRAIADLLRANSLASQDELAERLSELGFAVAQATISRDLEHLGAVKIRRGGTVTYALPDQLGGASWAGPRLEAILREWVRSIEPAGNLIILKTPPGSAHLVGVALDQAELPEVAGTISGDDTVFVAVREPASAASLVDRLSAFDSARQA
jgi:transcriptional regulator of arginine metabolism